MPKKEQKGKEAKARKEKKEKIEHKKGINLCLVYKKQAI